jgi:dolichol-phosphate mannosyltransferase
LLKRKSLNSFGYVLFAFVNNIKTSKSCNPLPNIFPMNISQLQENLLLPVPSGDLKIPSINVPEQPTFQRQQVDSVYFSLVVPTFNESENIENIVSILSALLDEAIGSNYELIIVDDNSPDGTWQRAQALMSHYPHLKVMRREHERGLSTAVIRGWQAARGQVLGVIDGDMQHPPESLLQLLTAIQQGADLAVASRHVEGGGVSNWSATRRFLSRGAQMLGLMILPNVVGRVSDPMSGYFLVRRSSIAGVYLSPVGYKILLEVLGRGNVDRVAEVGYVFQERLEGESKVTWKQYVDYITHLLKLRSRGRIGRLRQKLQFPLARFIRFCIVGFSGVLIDMAVFYLLRVNLGLGIARSTILSAETAVINNFLWNDLWTFSDISRRQPETRYRIKRFLKFNIICLAGIILQTLVVSLMYDFLGVNEFVSKLFAIVVVTLWNFWINLKLSWRVTQTNK